MSLEIRKLKDEIIDLRRLLIKEELKENPKERLIKSIELQIEFLTEKISEIGKPIIEEKKIAKKVVKKPIIEEKKIAKKAVKKPIIEEKKIIKKFTEKKKKFILKPSSVSHTKVNPNEEKDFTKIDEAISKFRKKKDEEKKQKERKTEETKERLFLPLEKSASEKKALHEEKYPLEKKSLHEEKHSLLNVKSSKKSIIKEKKQKEVKQKEVKQKEVKQKEIYEKKVLNYCAVCNTQYSTSRGLADHEKRDSHMKNERLVRSRAEDTVYMTALDNLYAFPYEKDENEIKQLALINSGFKASGWIDAYTAVGLYRRVDTIVVRFSDIEEEKIDNTNAFLNALHRHYRLTLATINKHGLHDVIRSKIVCSGILQTIERKMDNNRVIVTHKLLRSRIELNIDEKMTLEHFKSVVAERMQTFREEEMGSDIIREGKIIQLDYDIFSLEFITNPELRIINAPRGDPNSKMAQTITKLCRKFCVMNGEKPFSIINKSDSEHIGKGLCFFQAFTFLLKPIIGKENTHFSCTTLANKFNYEGKGVTPLQAIEIVDKINLLPDDDKIFLGNKILLKIYNIMHELITQTIEKKGVDYNEFLLCVDEGFNCLKEDEKLAEAEKVNIAVKDKIISKVMAKKFRNRQPHWYNFGGEANYKSLSKGKIILPEEDEEEYSEEKNTLTTEEKKEKDKLKKQKKKERKREEKEPYSPIFFDFETVKDMSGKGKYEWIPYYATVKDQDEVIDFKGQNAAINFVDYLNELEKKTIVVGFNNRSFDNFLIMNIILEKYLNPSIKYFSNKLSEIIFTNSKGKRIKIYDLRAMLPPGSLDSTCIDYKIKKAKVSGFDHNIPQGLYNEFIKTKSSKDSISEMISILEEKYNLQSYAEHDVICLQEIYDLVIPSLEKLVKGILQDHQDKNYTIHKIKNGNFTNKPLIKEEIRKVKNDEAAEVINNLRDRGIEVNILPPPSTNPISYMSSSQLSYRIVAYLNNSKKTKYDHIQEGISRASMIAGRCEHWLGENVNLLFKKKISQVDKHSMYTSVSIIGNKFPKMDSRIVRIPCGKRADEYEKIIKTKLCSLYCEIDESHLLGKQYYREDKNVIDLKTGKHISGQQQPVIPSRNEDGVYDYGNYKIHRRFLLSSDIMHCRSHGGKVTVISDINILKELPLFKGQPLAQVRCGQEYAETTTDLMNDYCFPLIKIKNDMAKKKGTSDYNAGVYLSAKMLLNAITGKFSQRAIDKMRRIVNTKELRKIGEVINLDTATFTNIRSGQTYVTGKYLEYKIDETTYPTFISAFIYSYARQDLYDKIISKVNTYYTDTDSALISAEDLPKIQQFIDDTDKKVGWYGNEWDTSKKSYDRFINLKKKEYIIFDEKTRAIYKSKGKGISYKDNYCEESNIKTISGESIIIDKTKLMPVSDDYKEKKKTDARDANYSIKYFEDRLYKQIACVIDDRFIKEFAGDKQGNMIFKVSACQMIKHMSAKDQNKTNMKECKKIILKK